MIFYCITTLWTQAPHNQSDVNFLEHHTMMELVKGLETMEMPTT